MFTNLSKHLFFVYIHYLIHMHKNRSYACTENNRYPSIPSINAAVCFIACPELCRRVNNYFYNIIIFYYNTYLIL